MRFLRKVLVGLVRVFAKRYIPPRITVSHDRIVDIRMKITGASPMVVDGGGHYGEFTDVMLRQYDNPFIHVIEAVPELADGLRDKYKDINQITVHKCALGAKDGSVSLNVTECLPVTSVLKSSDLGIKYHGDLMNISETIDVRQNRLDKILDCEIDILKFDLQGYELEALKGCSGLLDKVKLILIEVEFVALYQDQPLFSDIDLFLREKGFYLLNFYDLYTHSDGQLTSADAIYLNSHYYK